MRRLLACTLVLAAIVLCHLDSAGAQQAAPPPVLALGNAVVTGFSGVLAPDSNAPRPPNRTATDLTFINPDGPSARIVDLGTPGYVWDGRHWPATKPRDILTKDTGQVFGIALDDQPDPNIYLAATSAFGLHIARRAPNGTIERLRTGAPGAQWQNGQFGLALQGGPGSIYKVDALTGVVTLFANVMLDSVPNAGPGLGNLAYDAARKQLFASDLYTGMIHRFAVADGAEAGAPFDHGVAGRTAANLPPVPFDPRNRLNLTNARFDSTNPETWGFAPPDRRVWGLAVREGRLYYSARNGAAAEGPQIWSVGIAQDGSFAADPRWEFDVPAQPGPYAVSDIAFSQRGAMILAQRAPIAGSYDYTAFTRTAEPRVLRFSLESPDNPATPGRWVPTPEEYAVGHAGSYRNTNGGVALGYGYGQDGRLGANACEFSLWTTGQNLRNNPARQNELAPGGPLLVHGLQGSPAAPVRSFNEPPTTSYFIDYDNRFEDPAASGHLGSVRIHTVPCAATAAYGGPGSTLNPPYISNPTGGESGDDICRTCPPPPTPVDLAIKKTGATTPQPQVGAYSFTLTVTNTGAPFTAGLNVVTVSDIVPAGMSFTSATGTAGWTCLPLTVPAGGTLTCTFAGGLIPTGVVGTITIAATAAPPPPFPPFTNCATVGIDPASNLQDSNPSNDKDCVTIKKPDAVDVAIVKTGVLKPAEPLPVPGPSSISYGLAVTNVGAGFSGASAITVSDIAPAGVTFSSYTVTLAGNWTCTLTPAALNCTYIGSGPASPGDLLGTFTIEATATGNGPWENCAETAIAPSAGTDANLADNKSCVTHGFDKPKDPPPLAKSCGTNVIFVVDVSASIVASSAGGTVQTALNNAKQLFNNVNSGGVQAQGAVITFSDTATILQPMSAATLTTFTTLTYGGETNWEAGLALAHSVASSSPTPVIIVFITDGVPNKYIDSGGNVVSTPNSILATNEAIAVVNQIYTLGVPIVGVGVGSVSTHLNALLGGNASNVGFGGLYSHLEAFAKEMCPDLYLKKYMSPGSVNYHNNPGPHQATITLVLQNSSAAPVTGVQVKDALPPGLTGATSTDPNFSFSGGVVTWTVGALAANASVALTFKATIVPPALTCNWSTIRNVAQVTAVNEAIHSHPNSVVPPATGAVVEHDEAAAGILVRDCEVIITPTDPYLLVTKSSLESCYPTGQQGPVPGTAICSFTVQVKAIGNFIGNVVFSDAVIPVPGSTPISSAVSSIVLTPPPAPSTQTYCVSSFTTLPATCTQNGVTLNNGHIITYKVTLGAPPNLPPGNYKQCFIAAKDTLTPAQKDWPLYYGATPTSSNWYSWGYCGLFTVPAAPAGLVAVCDPLTTTRQGNTCVCRFPAMAKTSQTACACPTNARLVAGRGCVSTVVCTQPLVLNAAGTECVRPPQECLPPMIPGPVAGSCSCPQGSTLRGRECVPNLVCRLPMMLNPAGTACVCSPGTVQRGRECVRQIECRPPAKANRAGNACLCPPGTIAQGRDCVPERVQPRLPNFPGFDPRGPRRDEPRPPRAGGGQQGPAGIR